MDLLVIKTVLTLKGPEFLEYKSKSDDPRLPVSAGRFLNTLPDKKLNVSGVVTKLDQRHALSTKTLTDVTLSKNQN